MMLENGFCIALSLNLMIEHAGMVGGTSPSPMASLILGSGGHLNLMDLEFVCGQMVANIRGYLGKGKGLDMAYSPGLLGADTRGSGKKTNVMAKDETRGQIRHHL